MRVILASLFVFVGVLLALLLLGDRLERSPIFLGLLMSAIFLVLCLVALVLFNTGRPLSRQAADYERQMRAWEEQGLLDTTEYTATRGFQVEEIEDEGLHYFLQLEDGSVLYLSGQYLYSVLPTDSLTENGTAEEEDERMLLSNAFCTRFTIRRHREEGFVVSITCHGELLLLDKVMTSAFWENPYWLDDFPQDGEIITDRTYAQLLAMQE